MGQALRTVFVLQTNLTKVFVSGQTLNDPFLSIWQQSLQMTNEFPCDLTVHFFLHFLEISRDPAIQR